MTEKGHNRKPMRCPSKAERDAARAAAQKLERDLAAVPVPDDIKGDAYIAAYRKGWVARDNGKLQISNPWPLGSPGATGSYGRVWLRGWHECGRARVRALARRPVGQASL